LRNWSCYLLSIVRLHSPDCEYCDPGASQRGEYMRTRLEDLQSTEPRGEDPERLD
jgi:hypothetical protein